MRIMFQAKHGEANIRVPYFGAGSPYREWENGQVREIPDGEKVAFRVSDGGPIKTVSVEDALYSGGPTFVDADTKINPDYRCSECGKETLDQYFIDPFDNQRTYYNTQRDGQGDVLCITDFIKRNPQHVGWHRQLGVSDEKLFGSPEPRETTTAPLKQAQPKQVALPQQVEE